MTGKAIISNAGGWSCTATARLDHEDTPLRDVTGKLTGVKRRHFVHATNVYDVNAGFDRAGNVDVAIMMGRAVKCFTGALKHEKDGTVTIGVTPVEDGEKLKAMISKIKQIGGN